jgi:hypothetical protein
LPLERTQFLIKSEDGSTLERIWMICTKENLLPLWDWSPRWSSS